jgi:hypothetical protein
MTTYTEAAQSNGPAHLNTAVVKRVSWAAVFAGGIVAIVVQLLLALLGTGIGMSTVDPLTAGATPDASSLGIGAAVWWTISSVVALFAGGWVAGHLAGVPVTKDSVLHGILVWGIATIAAVYLISSAAGSIVRGVAGVAGGAASMAATGAAAAAGPATDAIKSKLDESGIDINALKSEATKLLGQTGKPALQPSALEQKVDNVAQQARGAASSAAATPQATDDEFSSLLDRVMNAGKSTVDQVDKDAVVNVVMSRAGVSREEATRRVDAWAASYQQARAKAEEVKAQAIQKAKEAADATAKATSRGAFGAFVALLLGAIAAAFGGAVGRPRVVATRF